MKKIVIFISLKKIVIFTALLILIIFAANRVPQIFNIKNEYSNKPTAVSITNTYDIFIDLETNNLYLFENSILLKSYSIASGTRANPSPVGIWKIVSKSSWGEGFGGNWMGLNVPWGTYGIHGTTSPWSIGLDASHGCIRMLSKDAEEVYNLVSVGTTVVISAGPFGPFSDRPRIIKPGDRGSDVLIVQKQLKQIGVYKGSLDGIYGDVLKNALFKFQKLKGYKVLRHEIYKSDLKKMGFDMFE